jgi:hypothetical protein
MGPLSAIGRLSPRKRLWLIAFLVLAACFQFLTGGVGLETIKHFSETQLKLNNRETLHLNLEGRSRDLRIPFLLSWYSVSGPYRLSVYYTVGDEKKTHRGIRLISAVALEKDGRRHALLPRGTVLTAEFEEIESYHSSSGGRFKEKSQIAILMGTEEVDIPFKQHLTVTVHLILEVLRNDGVERLDVSKEIEGDELLLFHGGWPTA